MAVVYTVNGKSKLWPMKTHTLIMMLTLVVAGIVIGCSSVPAAPVAPVANLSEKEAIAIARSSEGMSQIYSGRSASGCWYTEADTQGNIISNFSHTESASFKLSGIWVVTAESSWNWKNSTMAGYIEYPCTYVVDDATGRVTQN